MKIDKIYINEAIRIRKEYYDSINNILKQEKILLKKKEEIDDLRDNMEEIVHSDIHDLTKKLKLNNHLLSIDRIIKKIQEQIRPDYEKIEKLRTDADNLYNSIKEKYPNIKEDEIKEEISPYLEFE